MRQLTAVHKVIYLQEKGREPEPGSEVPRPVIPGDRVYIRVFRRKCNEPRREGPYEVVRATRTAIQGEGSTTWYHLNHCTKAQRIPLTEALSKGTEKQRQENGKETSLPSTSLPSHGLPDRQWKPKQLKSGEMGGVRRSTSPAF
ncbi:retrovirus-related Pol polyprotein [Salvelinus sp. IW2-2015]|uniref:retrovirus-related Pol polyprotein n=1 Tax=Salvelinus sp. IW2-2015 TaxID=2691554 RepID=UPI0038D3900F